MCIDKKYKDIKELEKKLKEKQDELVLIKSLLTYQSGLTRSSLKLTMELNNITDDIMIVQQAIIIKQQEILKGTYFPYNKK